MALLLGRPRDVRLTLDARLQQRVARALRAGIERGAHTRGAAVVLDVETGDVLASVSYPWPSGIDGAAVASDDRQADALARSRALRRCIRRDRRSSCSSPPPHCARHPELQTATHMCVRLPGGRVGNAVRGWTRPVRDDVKDSTPHGAVDLHEGLVVSCNAYFAQLAMQLGPRPLLDAVSLFQIEAARPSTVAALRNTLPHAAYGQADVLASPLKMARVVAAIAGDGRVLPARWTADDADATDDAPRFLAEADARRLAQLHARRRHLGHGPDVARQRHADRRQDGHRRSRRRVPRTRGSSALRRTAASRPIAFAVLVENAGYGARSAAPVAGEIVDAARELGLFR